MVASRNMGVCVGHFDTEHSESRRCLQAMCDCEKFTWSMCWFIVSGGLQLDSCTGKTEWIQSK
jgi:hypothetical protein